MVDVGQRLTACALFENEYDYIDLELPKQRPTHLNKRVVGGPVKAVVLNFAWKHMFANPDLYVAAGESLRKDLKRVNPNANIEVAENLPAAIDLACERTQLER